MVRLYCDSCNQEILGDRKATVEVHTKLNGTDSKTRHIYMDLCEKCVDKVNAFVDNLRQGE